jgi:hypothetical protein
MMQAFSSAWRTEVVVSGFGYTRATETALLQHDYLHSDCEFADLNRDCGHLEKSTGS